MRFVADLLHPAHVHVLGAITDELETRGHEVLFTARDKDVTLQLIAATGRRARVLSTQRSGAMGLTIEMAQRTSALTRFVRREKPDALIGIMGPSIAVVGRLLSIPSIVLYDTEIAAITNRWVYPLATAVLTPSSYTAPVRGRHVTYPGYHELAYLHPDRFTPDRAQLRRFGLRHDEPYSVVRFVSWKASHDLKDKGLDYGAKRRIVLALEKRGRVLISSEDPPPEDLGHLELRGPVELVHHLLAFATVSVGESATMASEAAVLGTPSIYIAQRSRGYIDDLARYGLVEVLEPHQVERAIELIRCDPIDDIERRREQMLADRVDTTTWVTDWLEAELT